MKAAAPVAVVGGIFDVEKPSSHQITRATATIDRSAVAMKPL